MIKLGRVLYIQTPARDNQLLGELELVLKSKGLKMSEGVKKRIRFYTLQIMLTNHCFGLLRGYPPSDRENLLALYFGAFTPVADDAMDLSGKTFEELLGDLESKSELQVLFKFLYCKIEPLFNEYPSFREYFITAHQAQNDSLLQLGEVQLDFQELQRISYNKGGYYTLLNRSMMLNPIPKDEESALLELGILFQLMNDLFDTYKDHKNEIQTLITRFPDYYALEHLFKSHIDTFKQKYFQLNYPEKNKLESSIIWALVISRGWIALRQYQKLQGNRSQLDIGRFKRKDLIVDMERPVNILRSIILTKRFFSSREY